MEGQQRKWNMGVFLFYAAIMLWLLFDRPGYVDGIPYWDQVQANLNLIPFRTLRLFAQLLADHRPYLVRSAVINLFGNVVMFVPLGFYLPALWQSLQKLWKTLLATAAIICLVEAIQLFTLVGSCDIDDLILNLLGAGIGYWLYRLFDK